MQKTVGQSSCYLNAQPRSPSSPLEFVPTVSSSCSFAQHSLCLVCCVPFLLSFGLNWSRHTLQIWLLCAGREHKHFVTLQVQQLEQNTTSLKNEAKFNLFRFETEISKLKSEGLLKAQQCEVQMVSQSIVHEIEFWCTTSVLQDEYSFCFFLCVLCLWHTSAHTFTLTYTHKHKYPHVHSHAHTRTHTMAHILTHALARARARTQTHTHTHTQTNTYAYCDIMTHTHAHTYTHEHTNTRTTDGKRQLSK